MADADPIPQADALRLVTAAAAAAGTCPSDPAEAQVWQGRVQELAVSLYRMVPSVAERCGRLAGVFPLPGTLLDVKEVSGRGVLVVRPEIGRIGKDENLRTGFLNTPEGRALFEQAQRLVGRRCRFGKRTETFVADGEPGKMALLEWIEPLEDTHPQAAPPGEQTSRRADEQTSRRAPTAAPAPRPTSGPLTAQVLGQLRTERPGSYQRLLEMAAEHIGLEKPDVDVICTALYGVAGPSTPNQLTRVWNQLITNASGHVAA